MLAHTFFYSYTNLYPWWPPKILPLFEIDYRIPLLPWTFLVYVSDYLFMFGLIYLHPETAHFRSMVRMCFMALTFCGLFFIFFPTTYPRPPYPQVGNMVIDTLTWLVGRVDTPNNCFPSLHVALTGCGAWSLRPLGVRRYLPFWIWAIAIFISTLTTKQHYFVDVLGGIVLVAAVAFIEWALFERKLSILPLKNLR